MVKNEVTKYLFGRSQAEMARDLGVTAQCVSRWVVGRSVPNQWLLPKVLEWLGAPMGRVLDKAEVWPED